MRRTLSHEVAAWPKSSQRSSGRFYPPILPRLLLFLPACSATVSHEVAAWPRCSQRRSGRFYLCVLLQLLLFLPAAASSATQLRAADAVISDADDLGPRPDPGDGYWNTTYNINGKPITLGEVDAMLRGNRPTYDSMVICAPPPSVCCPAYCCSVISTIHNLQKPFDYSRLERQTAYINGSSQILPQPDVVSTGDFVALLYHVFEAPIYGGWTGQLNFTKPVADLHSFNSEILGSSDGGKTFYLGPVYWNQNIAPGYRRILVQGVTTPQSKDNIPLGLTATLFYDRNAQPNPMSVMPTVPQEPRPVAPPPRSVHDDDEEKYDLSEALQLAILFYEIQRSGRLPKNKRIPWRGNADLDDRTDDGRDLSGGYYDAGDTIKMTLTMAYSAGVLTWGLLRYPQSFQAAGETDNMLDNIKWALDFFLKAHTGPREYYVQVSDEVDHCYWEAPEAADRYIRRAYKVTCDNPGSQPVMLSAAAMAAGSLVFRDKNRAYADLLLKHAKELFEFGVECPGDYVLQGRIPAGGMYPGDGMWFDEEAWAAIWLFKATGQQQYLDKAKETYWQCCSRFQQMDNPWRVLHWSDMGLGVNLLLYETLGWDDFAHAITTHLDHWLHDIHRTPKGLAYLSQWGANRFASSAAFLALVAADLGLHPTPYRTFAAQQVFYMLGDCCIDQATGRSNMSHLIGFGPAWPRSVHHRAASCDSKGTCNCTPNPLVHTVWGGLIGGPDEHDQLSMEGCPDFIHMEVTIDYNAAFISAVAGLKALSLGRPSRSGHGEEWHEEPTMTM